MITNRLKINVHKWKRLTALKSLDERKKRKKTCYKKTKIKKKDDNIFVITFLCV